MNNLLAFNRAPRTGEPSLERPLASNLPALVVIGGLLTIEQVAEWYSPLLRLDTTSDAPAHARFIAPPQRGLGQIEDMREQLYDRIDDIHARVGIEKKLLLVGHSLGALLANLVALDKPEKVAGVVALTGVHDGIKKETPASLALRYALGNPPHGKVLKHDSEFMEELRERRTNEWPAGVPLDVISTALDYLIVPPQGYGIQLPNGERSNDKLIVPRGLGLEAAVRLSLGIKKEVQVVRSGYFEPVEHVNAPRNRLVINSIKERWLSLGGAAPDVSVESAKKVVLRSQPQAAVA